MQRLYYNKIILLLRAQHRRVVAIVSHVFWLIFCLLLPFVSTTIYPLFLFWKKKTHTHQGIRDEEKKIRSNLRIIYRIVILFSCLVFMSAKHILCNDNGAQHKIAKRFGWLELVVHAEFKNDFDVAFLIRGVNACHVCLMCLFNYYDR